MHSILHRAWRWAIMAAPTRPSWVETVDQTAHYLSLVSVVGACIGILTFLLFPSKRTFPARLPLHVLVATLGVSISVFVGTVDKDKFCPYEAVGIELFGLACVTWWLIISYNFYRAAVLHRGTSPTLEPLFVGVGWGLPLLVTVICVACKALDTQPPQVGWECWMANEHGQGQWVFFYGEMGVACLVGLYVWPQGLVRVYLLHRTPKTSAVIVSNDQTIWPRGLPGVVEDKSRSCGTFPALDGPERQSYGSTADAPKPTDATTPTSVVVSHVRHLLFVLAFQVVFGVMLAYRIVKDVSGKPVGYHLTMGHTISVSSTGLWAFVVFFLSGKLYVPPV